MTKQQLIQIGKEQLELCAVMYEEIAKKWALANNDGAYVASNEMAKIVRNWKKENATCIRYAA